MDWWLQLQQWGFKFDPTEVQLISDYLRPKVRGLEGFCDLIGISEQVYTNPPWEYYSCTDFPGGEKYYCYTELKKMNQNQNQNRVARNVGSYGNWHESNSKKIFGGDNYIIGFKKLLNFKENVGGKKMTTDWLMHEFSLSENQTDLVLCVIQKKKKKEEEMGSAYDTYSSFRGLCFTTSAGGDPCAAPAPAPAHDDHFQLQALDSEETRPGPLVDVSGLPNDVRIFPNNVPGCPNYGFV